MGRNGKDGWTIARYQYQAEKGGKERHTHLSRKASEDDDQDILFVEF